MAGEWLRGVSGLVEFGGALIVGGYCARAGWAVLRERQPTTARRLVTTGALMGLSVKLAATLLKTLYVASWSQVGMLAFVIVLKTVLEWTFARERERLPGA